MSKRFLSLFGLVAALAFSSPALAQTTPGGGGGTTGPAPTGPADNPGVDIDLPVGSSHVPAEYQEPPVESPTPTLYEEPLPTNSESIIYVLDVSGSMDWGTSSYTGLDGNPTSGTRLDRAKVELIRSIQGLTEDFTFNIFSFDCDLYQWSAARQQALPPAKAAACGWVGARVALGATGTGPACAAALQDRDNLTLILLSDGAPNCIGYSSGSTSTHRSMISAANMQHAVIHCFGIQAYGEFEQFLRDVARDSGGQYYPVP